MFSTSWDRLRKRSGISDAIAGAFVVALVAFVTRSLGREPLDDSYFFKRIARNLLRHGSLAWNVGEDPVHGNTSQLYQLVALAADWVSDRSYIVVIRVFGAACLGLWVVYAIRKRRADAVTTVWLYGSPVVLYTLVTGMETILVIVLVAVHLMIVLDPPARLRHWSVAPFGVAVIYLLRPDAALLAALPLICVRWSESRKVPWRELCLLLVVMSTVWVSFRLLYGSALPIPFHAKTNFVSSYGSDLAAKWRADKISNVALFAVVALPILLAAVPTRDRTSLILLATTILFVSYHLVSTIEINGNYARFYAPAIPLVAQLGCRSQHEFSRRGATVRAAAFIFAFGALFSLNLLPDDRRWYACRVPDASYAHLAIAGAMLIPCAANLSRAGMLKLLAALVLCSWPLHVQEGRALAELGDRAYLCSYVAKVSAYPDIWPLRRCLGSDIHVYHSEIGVVGVLFEDGRVTDLAGLFTPKLLHDPDSFDATCASDLPEAIYLPEPNSNTIRATVAKSDCLRGRYTRVAKGRSPLFVRKDLRQRYAACAAEVRGREMSACSEDERVTP